MTDAAQEPPYSGPSVVIEPEGLLYGVEVRPHEDGGPRSQLFACKSAAWGEMLSLCVALGLPPLNLCDGQVAAHETRKKRGETAS